MLKNLALSLSKSPKIIALDASGESESWTLANGLMDLSSSFKRINDELLPKLLDKNASGENIDEILWDIGDELRHIIYHINDSRYFNYLYPCGGSGNSVMKKPDKKRSLKREMSR